MNHLSYNRYSYVFNNPLTFNDPSGFVANHIHVPHTDSFYWHHQERDDNGNWQPIEHETTVVQDSNILGVNVGVISDVTFIVDPQGYVGGVGRVNSVEVQYISHVSLDWGVEQGCRNAVCRVGEVAGKIWSLPNSIIGGGIILGVSAIYEATRALITLDASRLAYLAPDVYFKDGNLVFDGISPVIMGTAMTLGNVIVYGKSRPGDNNRAYVDSPLKYTVEKEEVFHSKHSQILGPLYYPLHLMGGLRSLSGYAYPNGILGNSPWHKGNFMEYGPQRGRVF